MESSLKQLIILLFNHMSINRRSPPPPLRPEKADLILLGSSAAKGRNSVRHGQGSSLRRSKGLPHLPPTLQAAVAAVRRN
ncbi:hypothetical protein AAFF_G00304150 [Aldrovandia affinis]|uniref:Uncharacterized protein n=1 Tax=Aldrovandia affinis TaxID=143900 RepID=A0AAD7WRZ7_9TELE|nr:hypothetical protein AAFF_G00304150 [Aldrovandia affinis]